MDVDASAWEKLAALRDAESPNEPEPKESESSDIWDTLRQIVAQELEREPENLHPHDRLIHDLECDTLQRYAIITQVEHELGCTCIDADIDAALTLADMVKVIEGSLQ